MSESPESPVKCPHCGQQFVICSSPVINFRSVWLHMIEFHFDIAYDALCKQLTLRAMQP